jgi:hypothetical protein
MPLPQMRPLQIHSAFHQRAHNVPTQCSTSTSLFAPTQVPGDPTAMLTTAAHECSYQRAHQHSNQCSSSGVTTAFPGCAHRCAQRYDNSSHVESTVADTSTNGPGPNAPTAAAHAHTCTYTYGCLQATFAPQPRPRPSLRWFH